MEFIQPSWRAHKKLTAFTTTRTGGVSVGPYSSLNLALHVGDDAASVRDNRARVEQYFGLPKPIVCPQQVHGTGVIDAQALSREGALEADAVYSNVAATVCAILTADCLPILLASKDGSEVAAVHAGWRGLLDDVIEAALARFSSPPERLDAWIGPGISSVAYQVGAELRARFIEKCASDDDAFRFRDGSWYADLPQIARNRLKTAGLGDVFSYHGCTSAEAQRFFSYRRDGTTGRMVSIICPGL